MYIYAISWSMLHGFGEQFGEPNHSEIDFETYLDLRRLVKGQQILNTCEAIIDNQLDTL